jgi:alkylated DNA repair dioxygenase AlkB
MATQMSLETKVTNTRKNVKPGSRINKRPKRICFSGKTLTRHDWFYYIPQVVSSSTSRLIYNQIVDFVKDEPPKMTRFGYVEPRITVFFAKNANHPHFLYAGVEQQNRGWPDFIQLLCTVAEQITQQQFDSAHVNWYRDGRDSVGAHSDKDSLNCTIVSFSFNCTRSLKITPNDSEFPILEQPMQDGSVLVMLPGMQEASTHEVPKLTSAAIDDREKLVFGKRLSSGDADTIQASTKASTTLSLFGSTTKPSTKKRITTTTTTTTNQDHKRLKGSATTSGNNSNDIIELAQTNLLVPILNRDSSNATSSNNHSTNNNDSSNTNIDPIIATDSKGRVNITFRQQQNKESGRLPLVDARKAIETFLLMFGTA